MDIDSNFYYRARILYINFLLLIIVANKARDIIIDKERKLWWWLLIRMAKKMIAKHGLKSIWESNWLSLHREYFEICHYMFAFSWSKFMLQAEDMSFAVEFSSWKELCIPLIGFGLSYLWGKINHCRLRSTIVGIGFSWRTGWSCLGFWDYLW